MNLTALLLLALAAAPDAHAQLNPRYRPPSGVRSTPTPVPVYEFAPAEGAAAPGEDPIPLRGQPAYIDPDAPPSAGATATGPGAPARRPVVPPTAAPRPAARARTAGGAASPADAETSRTSHRFGVLLGVMTHPVPSIIGFNAAYNFLDWLRIQGGVGFISLSSPVLNISTTTVTGEAQFLVPGWSFSPVGLIGLGAITGTIEGSLENETAGLTDTAGYVFIGGGLDWQTWLGFALQLHFKFVMSPTGSAGLPGVALGWFF